MGMHKQDGLVVILGLVWGVLMLLAFCYCRYAKNLRDHNPINQEQDDRIVQHKSKEKKHV